MKVWGVSVSEQEPAYLPDTQERMAQALQVEQLPPLLPKPALLAAQSQGNCRLDQGPQAMVVERDGWRGAGSGNSAVGTGLPKTENLSREWGQHRATIPCYNIAAGLFPMPSRKDPERKFT